MIPPCAVNHLATSTWASLPWVLGRVVRSKVHSTQNAAVAIIENDAASTLLRRLVAPGEEANTLAESACPVCSSTWNSHASLSYLPKDAQRVAEGARLRDDENREQFRVALLEDCSFFARLVLRYVRAGGNPSRCLLDRNSPRKKSKSRSRLVKERALQPEMPSSFLQTLWVEVGCRHAQTVVSEKERHEYRKDSKPAL